MHSKQRVLIIGGLGYVGGRLYDFLKETGAYEPDSVDINWFGNYSHILNDEKDFNTLTPEEYSVYDVIVLLAGHSSVKMCGDAFSTMRNNVFNFVDLIKKLEKLTYPPKLLYASSSSVYGDSKEKMVKETDDKFVPNNYYDLSKHEIDLYAQVANKNPNLEIYGLRFGTVNGWSKNLRSDIMINAMFASAGKTGEINLFNPQVHRPILGVEDLCRSVLAILDKGNKSMKGLYNLASFNSTSEEIARTTAHLLDAHVMMREPLPLGQCDMNSKLQSVAYDFSMDTTKFEQSFGFKFNDSIESIVNSLRDKERYAVKTYRNETKLYCP